MEKQLAAEKYFDIKLNNDQQKAVRSLINFFNNPGVRIFILKGYAGTGKTTIAKGLINYLKDQEIPSVLLASTGRAAKILRDKTGSEATTIHKHIYDFEDEELDEKLKLRKLKFRLLDNLTPQETVYFVDESSMISNEPIKGTFVNFGTGRLMADLFHYTGKRKIVFIGDPAQLPPVNCKFSAALIEDFIEEKFQLKVETSELTKIVRFKAGSGIFHNTDFLRNQIKMNIFPMLSVKAYNQDDIQVHPDIQQMCRHYVQRIRQLGVENCIFITLSNKQASYINSLTRSYLFSAKKAISFNRNESLMVVRNNYLYNLNNGDHILVKSISPETEYRAGLKFRKAEIYHMGENGSRVLQVMLIENLLEISTPDLDSEQEYKLFVDFVIRMKKAGLRPQDDKFKEMMMQDKYLNALRVKYGYAITCHKAQGGEWQEVFVQFEKSMFYFPKPDLYRWTYTALSRSMQKLHLLNNRCIY